MNRSRILGIGVALLSLFTVACSKDPAVLKQEHLAKGNEYFNNKRYAEATIEYKTVLQYDPQNGPAYFRLGEIYEKLEDPAAIGAYVRAADLLPKDIEAQIRAANYLIAVRKFEDARTTALKAVLLDPKNVEAQILVGNASAGLNDYERAIRELQAAQALDASDARIYNNIGWFEALRGRSVEAEEVFRRAVATAPKSAAAHLGLANYLGATGRRSEAEKSLRTAVAVEPADVPALRAMGWFLLMSNRPKEAEPFLIEATKHDVRPDSHMLLADFYSWSGRDPDAVRVLEELKAKSETANVDAKLASVIYRTNRPRAESLVKAALKASPQNAEAQLLSIQFLVDDRKLNEAKTAIQGTLTQRPGLSQAHFLNGKILFELGEFKAATSAFTEAANLNPRAVTARLFLARLHLRNNRPAAAQQVIDEVLALAPGNPAARLMLAQTRQAMGDRVGATRMVADLVAGYPDWPPVLNEAARLAVARSDWAGARSALDRLEAADPESRPAFEGRLAVDVGTKNYKSAFERLDGRLAKTPDDERLLLVAAQVYTVAGDGARAESALKRALSVNPANKDAYDQLARLYANLGRLPESETQFAALAERSTDAEYGWIMAAVLAQALGKVDIAQQRYEKALSINPEAAVAANNLAYLYAEKGGNLDMALNLAQTAKRLKPENANYLDTLGVVLLKKGLSSAAIVELQAAADRAPQNATVQFHLAQALVAVGKHAEAQQAARHALAIDAGFPQAKDARALAEGKNN